MIKKYNEWHQRLSPLYKVVLSFFLNWLFWFFAWLVVEKFILNEHYSWRNRLFHATWMSFIITIPANWKELKHTFKPKKSAKKEF